jgi:hypothetical protein
VRLFRDTLVAVAVLLLVVGIIDTSVRGLVGSCVCGVAAYGVHRQFLVVWWAGICLLVWAAIDAVAGFFRGPGTGIALMSSLLGFVFSALVLSVWLRQRSHFQRHVILKA